MSAAPDQADAPQDHPRRIDPPKRRRFFHDDLVRLPDDQVRPSGPRYARKPITTKDSRP